MAAQKRRTRPGAPPGAPQQPALRWNLARWAPWILLLATFAAYLPALKGWFIWDDDFWVFGNRAIKAANGLRSIWFSTQLPDYFPLTATSFWLEWRLWGTDPLGYHLTNVLLHGLGVVLLWRVLRLLEIPGAWLAALLYAVHPVNVESVAWISERKNTLSLAFFLLSLFWFLRSEAESKVQSPKSELESKVQSPKSKVQNGVVSASDPGSSESRRCYLLSLGAFLLALLAKTSVVMLPLVLLLCLWWQRRPEVQRPKSKVQSPKEYEVPGAKSHASRLTHHASRITPLDLTRLVPFVLLSVTFGLVTVWFQYNRAIGTDVVRASGMVERLATAGRAVWFYLGKALVPQNLMVIYPRWQSNPASIIAWLPALAILGVLAVAWWFRRGWGRSVLFALGYFLVMLLPVLGFLNISFFKYSFVADRWQYLALIGIVTFAVGWLWSGKESPKSKVQSPKEYQVSGARYHVSGATPHVSRFTFHASRITHHASRLTLSAAIVLTLFVLTWRRAQVFANSETLWRETLAKNPLCWVAELNWGSALEDKGMLDEAQAHFARALAIDPNHEEIHNNLGQLWVAKGQPEKAITEFNAALALNSDFALVHYHLGSLLQQQQQFDAAKEHFLAAVRSAPDYAEAYNSLAAVLERQGKVQEAIGTLSAALVANPNVAPLHHHLGRLLESQNKLDEAREHFLKAIRLAPDSAESHNELAFILASQGHPEEAAEHLTQAVRLDPNSLSAQNNLGRLLLSLGRPDVAWLHCSAAVRIAPDSPDAHYNLANVLLAQKRVPEATAEFKTVLRLAPDFSEARTQLAMVLATGGQTTEAVEHFRQILRADTNDLAALNSLAWILATSKTDAVRDGAESLRLASQAAQLTGNLNPVTLDILAAAYAETGRFTEAAATAQRAIEEARSAGQTNLVQTFQTRLRVYQAGRPFREP